MATDMAVGIAVFMGPRYLAAMYPGKIRPGIPSAFVTSNRFIESMEVKEASL
jgi:hypothetical protein